MVVESPAFMSFPFVHVTVGGALVQVKPLVAAYWTKFSPVGSVSVTVTPPEGTLAEPVLLTLIEYTSFWPGEIGDVAALSLIARSGVLAAVVTVEQLFV
jgi:hypothetical protein